MTHSPPSDLAAEVLRDLYAFYGDALSPPDEGDLAEWSRELAGVPADAARAALDVLDPFNPPDAAQFRAMCAPQPQRLAAQPAVSVGGVVAGRQAAIALWQRKLADPRTTVGVRHMAERALRNLRALG